MPNVWRIFGTDKAGKEKKMRLKGPTTADSAKRLGQQVFDSQRRRAIYTGAGDPELRVTKVEPIGDDEGEFGRFMPRGVKPIDLNEYAKKDDAGEPLLPAPK